MTIAQPFKAGCGEKRLLSPAQGRQNIVSSRPGLDDLVNKAPRLKAWGCFQRRFFDWPAVTAIWKSGGGPPHSRTLPRGLVTPGKRGASWSAPVLWRFPTARQGGANVSRGQPAAAGAIHARVPAHGHHKVPPGTTEKCVCPGRDYELLSDEDLRLKPWAVFKKKFSTRRGYRRA